MVASYLPSSDCIFKLNLNTWLNDYIKCLRDQKNEIFKRYVKDEAPNTVYQNLQVIASDVTKAISGSKMFTMNVFLISSMTLQLHLNVLFNNQCVFGPASARPYKIGVVGNNWMVGNAVFSETAESVFSDFLNEVRGLIKVEK